MVFPRTLLLELGYAPYMSMISQNLSPKESCTCLQVTQPFIPFEIVLIRYLSVLQEVMSEVMSWCEPNQLIIHKGKTDVLILDSKNLIGLLLPIKLGQAVIQYKSYSDCLGVRIDSTLYWNDCIKGLVNP